MDALSLAAVIGFAVVLTVLAHVTGRHHRGPFAYLLGRMVKNVAPYSAAIARMLYGAAGVLVGMALATLLWPQEAGAIARWSAIAVTFIAALAAAIPTPLLRPNR